jgi:hypothetical protein
MSAKEETQTEEQKPDPVAMLQELHDSGQGLDPKQRITWLRFMRTENTGEAEREAR